MMKIRELERVKLVGRPERDTVISEDDVLNLKILMELSAPVGEDPLEYFLSLV